MRSGETTACYRLAWENLVRFQNVSQALSWAGDETAPELQRVRGGLL